MPAITTATKGAGLVGALLLVGALFTLDSNKSPDKVAVAEGGNPNQALITESDADSPLDTIRRLQQYSQNAVEAAEQSERKLTEHRQQTDQKFDQLTAELRAERESAGRKERELSDMRQEVANLMALMQGQLNADQREPALPVTDPDTWAVIEPVNQVAGTDSNNPLLSSVDTIRANQGALTTVDGFLLSSNTSHSTGSSQTPTIERITDHETGHTVTPIATIPVNSPLLNAVTLSTLIGRIPKGGSVFEPFNFYVQTGHDNWTSQDHAIPFIERAIWRGTATGDKDLECIRGQLLSVTFVFTDGRISTQTGTKNAPLAELTTPTGSNCVPGQYVSNTAKYIALYGIGGGIAGLGEAIAENETVRNFTSQGGVIDIVNGNTGNFLAGRSLSASAAKVSEIIDEEYQNSYASVVLSAGMPVNMMALTQIEIDHDTGNRKVNYLVEE